MQNPLLTDYISNASQKVKSMEPTGTGGTVLGNMALSLGPKRKPWSKMFSCRLLQNDEELTETNIGSSWGQKVRVKN